jgi:predicted TIM-barrel enzyme
MLPLGAANEMALKLVEEEIGPICSVPYFIGLSAMDPTIPLPDLLKKAQETGATGVINFPTVSQYPKQVRDRLEEAGFGFTREVDMLQQACALGLQTIAHVTTCGQAERMASSGVDAVCFNYGWNAGGAGGPTAAFDLTEASVFAADIRRRVKRANASCLFMIEGGPIETADDLTTVLEASRADGYIGGSTIDRIPIETSVVDQTMMFKNAVAALEQRQTERLDNMQMLKRAGLYGTSQRMRIVAQHIERLSQTSGAAVATGEAGTGRERALRAIALGRGQRARDMVTLSGEELTNSQMLYRLFGSDVERNSPGFLARESGTVILRDLDDLPRRLQRRLGRYLEHGDFFEVGGRKRQSGGVDVFFCARSDALFTDSDALDPRLQQMLIGKVLPMPALRDRAEDMIEIINAFIREKASTGAAPHISPGAGRLLRMHGWPGNLSEALNVAERLMGEVGEDNRLSEKAVASVLSGAKFGQPAPLSGEREIILDALWRHGFNRTRTAAFLNISRKTLYNKIVRYGLTGRPS